MVSTIATVVEMLPVDAGFDAHLKRKLAPLIMGQQEGQHYLIMTLPSCATLFLENIIFWTIRYSCPLVAQVTKHAGTGES